MEQDQQQLRNLRDFLLVYNRMTEICFQRCTSNLNYRNLTMDEERCVDSCAGKLIRSNHRLMGTYVQLMPGIVQRRLEEMEAKSAEMTKAAEAGANGETLPLATATLVEGTESPPAFAQPSAEAEIPPVIAPPIGGAAVDSSPVIAPPISGAAVDFPPVIAPPIGWETAEIPPVWAPPIGGATAEIPPVFVPPAGGATVEIMPNLVPDSTGIAKEAAPMLAPATTAIPALSEMVKSLPEQVSTPPAPPVQKLPLPQQIDPPSLFGSSQSSPALSPGPSIQPGPDSQPPSQ